MVAAPRSRGALPAGTPGPRARGRFLALWIAALHLLFGVPPAVAA